VSAADGNSWSTPAAATAVAAIAPLSDEAKTVLNPAHSPREYVAALNATYLGVDAMKVIAFSLARREAVWWAAQCVKAVPALVAEPALADAVKAVEAWCANPTDELRRACYTASEVAEMKNPAGCVAMAVFLTEGSLGPPHVAVIPPPPNLGPGMAGSAVQLAAVVKFPEKANEKYAIFAQLAEAVSSRASRWPEMLEPGVNGKPATASAPPQGTARPHAPSSSASPPAAGGPKAFPPYPTAKR
jgi:hypothetical protein